MLLRDFLRRVVYLSHVLFIALVICYTVYLSCVLLIVRRSYLSDDQRHGLLIVRVTYHAVDLSLGYLLFIVRLFYFTIYLSRGSFIAWFIHIAAIAARFICDTVYLSCDLFTMQFIYRVANL